MNCMVMPKRKHKKNTHNGFKKDVTHGCFYILESDRTNKQIRPNEVLCLIFHYQILEDGQLHLQSNAYDQLSR